VVQHTDFVTAAQIGHVTHDHIDLISERLRSGTHRPDLTARSV
jgi:hypothetical protein